MVKVKKSLLSFFDKNSAALHKAAFTLAEVLIVLGVIGIVAEMTIPTLMSNVQDQAEKAAWKTDYAIVNQAVTMAVGDNSFDLTNVFPDWNTTINIFSQYISFTTTCSAGNVYGTCWHNASYFWLLNGTDAWPTNWGYPPGGIMKNGGFLTFGFLNPACTSTAGSIQYCMEFFVDVNGFKKPNKYGQDIFGGYITKNRVLPFGVMNDGYSPEAPNYDCDLGNNANASGRGCSSAYLYN